MSCEPWPYVQYEIFVGDPDFSVLNYLLVMYDKGMEEQFLTNIDALEHVCEGPLTFKRWLELYSEYSGILFQTPPDLHAQLRIPVMRAGSYFTTSVSDAGTSETGKIISPFDADAPQPKPNISLQELQQCTTARLSNLPHLKDLGLLQVQNILLDSEYPLYCWLDGQRYLLIPCKSRQIAKQISSDLNNMRALLENSDLSEFAICLRDMIVKITDGLIYTKISKTYYCLQKHDTYFQPVARTSARLDLAELQKFIMAKSILGITKKSICFGQCRGVYGMMYYRWVARNEDIMHDYPLPIGELQPVARDWLKSLSQHPLIQRYRINYDRLATEYL